MTDSNTPVDRRPVTGPLARGGRGRRRVRHPRRRDPARRTTRCSTPPRCGTCWSGTSRAPGTPPRGTRRPPAGSGSAWRPPARARPTWSPRSPTRTWTRCRSSRSPARCPSAAIGTDAFQEADICGITLPITKHNFLVQGRRGHPADDRRRRSTSPLTGRPGPGAGRPAQGRAAGRAPRFSWPPTMDLPGYRPVLKPHGKQIREAARLIAEARRPVLYVGGGVLKAHAAAELRRWPSSPASRWSPR